MSLYRVTVPYQHDMGSISPFNVRETPMRSKAEDALLVINDMRAHDGLEPRTRMPIGTSYKRIAEQ